MAAWIEAPQNYRYPARLGLRTDGESLWLRVDLKELPRDPRPFAVSLVGDDQRTSWALPDDWPRDSALGTCLEARLPLPAGRVRFSIEVGGERLPQEGLWELVFQEVDEP